MRMGVKPVDGKTRGAMILSFDAPPFRPVIRSLRLYTFCPEHAEMESNATVNRNSTRRFSIER